MNLQQKEASMPDTSSAGISTLAGDSVSLLVAPSEIMCPSPASTEESVGKVLIDHKTVDYRGFIFVVHASFGLMLLRCTRKKNKPLHWQLPGGHVDDPEFIQAAQASSDRSAQLLFAGKMGAARELFEETGLDVRLQLDRLEPAALRSKTKVKDGVELLNNEYKHRLFYFLSVTDDDYLNRGETPFGTEGKHLKLKLSIEHSGFIFQPEPTLAAEMLKMHSGGKVSEALLMSMGGAPERDDSTSADSVTETTNEPGTAPSPPTPSSTSLDPSPRRSKRVKETDRALLTDQPPIDLLPRPEKKSTFCCFGW